MVLTHRPEQSFPRADRARDLGIFQTLGSERNVVPTVIEVSVESTIPGPKHLRTLNKVYKEGY